MPYLVAGRMYAMCGVSICYTIQCMSCAATARTREMMTFPGMEVEWPMLPERWHILDGKPYCPQHAVVVGKPQAA